MTLAAFTKTALLGATTLPRYSRRPTVEYNVLSVLGAHSTETVFALAREAGVPATDRDAAIDALIEVALAA